MSTLVNLPAKLTAITKHWTPEHVLTINQSHSLKVAQIKGEFIWHSHPNTDEVFYCVSGGPFQLELEGQETVELKVGDIFCVPQGLRHRPVAPVETGILLIEKVGTVNTGDEESGAGKGRTVYVDEGMV